MCTRDRDRDRGHYKRDSRDLEGWSRQDNFDRTRGQSKEQELWDPRGKVGNRLTGKNILLELKNIYFLASVGAAQVRHREDESAAQVPAAGRRAGGGRGAGPQGHPRQVSS